MPLVVGVVLSVAPVAGKDKLRQCTVDVGAGEQLTIVTNAPNVREGTRTVVALVGTEVEVDGGETITVKKSAVGGIMSSGMLCDSIMCGWVGGGAGVAVQVPASMPPGAPAPTSKPRLDGAPSTDTAAAAAAPALSDKELKAKEKADRKAAAAAKKAARKDAKVKAEGEPEGEAEGEEGLATAVDGLEI